MTAISNSRTQSVFIMEQARRRGLGNLEALTADVAQLQPEGTFDRVVSVEMFEHMKNYKVSANTGCLQPCRGQGAQACECCKAGSSGSSWSRGLFKHDTKLRLERCMPCVRVAGPDTSKYAVDPREWTASSTAAGYTPGCVPAGADAQDQHLAAPAGPAVCAPVLPRALRVPL